MVCICIIFAFKIFIEEEKTCIKFLEGIFEYKLIANWINHFKFEYI
jgi:hypothetical protein